MSTEDIAAQYADRLLDFHLTHGTTPSQFLTWGNLTKCPSSLMDACLDGLDLDTISSLFDCLDAVKMMHIDLDIATNQWIDESYDIFNRDDNVSHNISIVPDTKCTTLCGTDEHHHYELRLLGSGDVQADGTEHVLPMTCNQ